MAIPKCNQCDSLYINGYYCHEIGCHNTHKEWNAEDEEWVTPEIESDEDPEWEMYHFESDDDECEMCQAEINEGDGLCDECKGQI